MAINMQKLQQKQHLEVNGVVVKITDDGLYCLNDLHKAAGGDASRRPGNWIKTESVKDVELALLNARQVAFKVEKGRYGGTYACKQMVYLYAMWLSPIFSLKVIEVFDAIASGDEQTALKVADTAASRARADELLTMMDNYANLTYMGSHTKTAVAAVLATEVLTPKHREDGEYHRKVLQRRGVHLSGIIKQVVRDQGNRTDMGKLVNAVERHAEICFDFSPEYLRDFTQQMITCGSLTESQGIIWA